MKFIKIQKNTTLISFLAVLAVLISVNVSAQDFYQLKIYNLKEKSQETRLDNYLKEAYIPALHQAGIKDVGVFKPIESDDAAGKKLFVLIPLNKLDQIQKLDDKLGKDKKYQAAGKEFLDAAWDNPPFERIESVILKAFSEMPDYAVPEHKTPKSERIYELRSYEGPTQAKYRKKVEMFNAAGEVDLFQRLGFQPVFFAEVLSGSAMPNLMYLTTFSNMESHDEHWDAFRNHPDWKAMSGLEEYKHTVSHSDKYLLHPTDYSDI